jgi:Glycosyl hydrolase family 115/Gylcosyl hydrolase family 115 C-terminal domain
MKNAALLSFLAMLSVLTLCVTAAHSQDWVTEKKQGNAFPIVAGSRATAIYVGEKDHWLVQKAASFLQQDIEMVTGHRPEIVHALPMTAENLIIIGSLDRSSLIGSLNADNKLHAADLKGKWEAFSLQVIDNPAKGIGRALVITGSDRRGTAYGVFTLSREIGVSPWYWWADVPVKKKTQLYIRDSTQTYGPPAVRYRGIFINDEAPAFSGWTKEKFGGVNHQVYEKIFELLLRLKANYCWPAMWGNAFNDDDTLNPILADKYGIVMGTSHHEPMLRAQQEWKRYGSGPWNYSTNADTLNAFWKKGIQHMGSHESIVTIGMRGDGDKPMTEGSNIELLEKIVTDQRNIIKDVTGKDPSAIPQLWALYKEVQDYYDKGMRVPDDVTLLLCDDNWGNIRKLPKAGEKPRGGGYGIYYHFDYVGGPRNYKWLNTNPISRIWEQMHLAWQYGVDRIWIVNVGDLKPMEFPIEFFLDYAWDPSRWPASRLDEYTRQWATKQFGASHADAIADILTKYTRYNGRRKPELLSPDTYSLIDYREAENVVADYNRLAARADSVYTLLPADYRNAYYQLVLFPVKACANLNELYVTTAKNRLYAAQGRAATNQLADRARRCFAEDSALSHYYNTIMAGGKWDHMMDQTHIGYTYWQQPPLNKMPDTKTIDLSQSNSSTWGIAIEGSTSWWPHDKDSAAILPPFDSYRERSHYIEIFNRDRAKFSYSIRCGVPWLHIAAESGIIDLQERIWVTVDWQKAPTGRQLVPITITVAGANPVIITAIVQKPDSKALFGDQPIGQDSDIGAFCFIEASGYISMEAAHYNRAVGTTAITWQTIPGLGRTLSGIEASPITSPPQTPGGNGPRLEYRFYLEDTGLVKANAYFSPTLDFSGTGQLRYAISLDDDPPQIMNLAENANERGVWDRWVSDNIIIRTSEHRVAKPGMHVLKYWLVDPGVVLQKIVVDAGGERPSYLGPPETDYFKRMAVTDKVTETVK